MRRDYAVFSDDKLVTNALLTVKEVKDMERDGFRCLLVRDTVGEGLPAFRGIRRLPSVRNSRRWDR